MAEVTKIVIADDHPIFRSGLRSVIESVPSLSVVGEADDGEAALRLIAELEPDVAILDVNMPVLSGFDVAAAIAKTHPKTKVVMLTMYREEAMFNQALNLGVCGYILKDSAANEIVTCLQAVRRGQNYTSPEVTKFLFKRASGQDKPVEGLASLTPTERRVLALIADYKTTREIADQLSVSQRTIENHRNNICAKLDLHGSHALMKYALQHRSEM